MAWTTPKTDWATGELVAAGDMNAIGENLAVLKQPATAVYTTTEAIRETTSVFADVDNQNLTLTITTTGGDVVVSFQGTVQGNGSNHFWVYFDVDVDGDRQGGDEGTIAACIRWGADAVSFNRLVQNLSPGTHTFKLQWKNSHRLRLISGAQFWVREI